jgi:hypothetical protein
LVSVDFALDPRLVVDTSLVNFVGDTRLLRAAAAHPLAEPFDRADVHPLLAKVLPRHIDLGLLAGAAEGDVGVLPIGLPAAGEDARAGLPWPLWTCGAQESGLIVAL